MDFFEELFIKRGSGGLNDYWTDASLGKINLDGSQIFDWKVINETRANFINNNPQRWNKMIAATAAFPNVNFSNYTGIIAIYNVSVGDAGNAGTGVLAGPVDWNVTFLAHETGHTFNLQHSFDQSTRLNIWWSAPGEYYDMHDIMSAMNVYSATSEKFGQHGPLLNIANLDRMNWLDPSRVWTQPGINGSPVSFDLVSLGHVEIPGYLAAKVGDLFIEFRTNDKWDSAIPRPTVLIHKMTGVNSIVMASDKTNYINDWQPGQIYGPQDTDWISHGGIRISIDSFNLIEKKARISVYNRKVLVDGPSPEDWHIYEHDRLSISSIEKSIYRINSGISELKNEITAVRKELFEINGKMLNTNRYLIKV